MTVVSQSLESSRITYYWQLKKYGSWLALLVTPKLTQRHPKVPKLLIIQSKPMGHWAKGNRMCCLRHDTFTYREPADKGLWKRTMEMNLCTMYHWTPRNLQAPAALSTSWPLCPLGEMALGFQNILGKWSVKWQQTKKCRYFLGLNGLVTAKEVKGWNYFILSWRTFQGGVKNYTLPVLHIFSCKVFNISESWFPHLRHQCRDAVGIEEKNEKLTAQ